MTQIRPTHFVPTKKNSPNKLTNTTNMDIQNALLAIDPGDGTVHMNLCTVFQKL